MRDKFNLTLPLMQTPMRCVPSPNLVIATCQAGGVGTLDATDLSPRKFASAIQTIRTATSQPFCVHLTVPQPYEINDDQIDILKQAVRPFFLEKKLDEPDLAEPFVESFAEQMQVVLNEKPAMFQFSCGIPALKWIAALKERGIFVIGTATHVDEALVLEKVGVDAVVVQGLEAFGERATFMGEVLSAMIPCVTLVQQICEAISLPVIANGGIANHGDLQNVLEAGAQMAQLATPLLLCDESGASDAYRLALLEESATPIFSNALTGRFARVLRCAFVDELLHYKPFMLPYPLQYALMKPLLACEIAYFAESTVGELELGSVATLLAGFCVEEVAA
jgi:nitronate monooxygenase